MTARPPRRRRVAIAHDRGIDFAFAPGSASVSSAPTSAPVVARDSAIRGPRDLLGKSVGVIALGGVNTISVQAWLEGDVRTPVGFGADAADDRSCGKVRPHPPELLAEALFL